MRYFIADQELDDIGTEMRAPEGYDGFGLVLRRRGVPVGFEMIAAPGGRTFSVAHLRDRRWPSVECSAKSLPLPRLTIAVCTHDRPDGLRRCLASLITLEGADSGMEVIVVDNAPSDDRTARTVAEFPGVRYVLERRIGLCAARNAAIRAAKGEIILFTDDDVAPDKRWLLGLRTAISEYPGASAFSGPVLPFELETEEQIIMEARGGLGHSFRRTLFSSTLPGSPTYPCGEACFGAGANMAFRMSVFDKVGLFDEVLGPSTLTRSGDDLDMFYRVIRAGLTWAYEPGMAVFHEHRRDKEALRKQVATWGCSTVAYLMKHYRTDPEYRGRIRRFLSRMLLRKVAGVIASALGIRRYRWPVRLAWEELTGAINGFTAYSRSLQLFEARRDQKTAEAA